MQTATSSGVGGESSSSTATGGGTGSGGGGGGAAGGGGSSGGGAGGAGQGGSAGAAGAAGAGGSAGNGGTGGGAAGGGGGGCQAGEVVCDGACADVLTDPGNCGMCGLQCLAAPDSCPYYGTCSNGACVVKEGPPGWDDCDCIQDNGLETNLMVDPANCGACDHACKPGQVCLSGTCSSCACPAGTTCCSDQCVNLASDPANCGACDHACAPGQTCIGGTCT